MIDYTRFNIFIIHTVNNAQCISHYNNALPERIYNLSIIHHFSTYKIIMYNNNKIMINN